MEITFCVHTKPVPQARPRFYVRHLGFKKYSIGAYDPKRSKSFKEVITWHAKIEAKKNGLQSPTKNPIAINLIFYMGQNKKGVTSHHVKKPDLDNLAKAVKDALKGIVYVDDSQIVEAHLYKRYGEPSVAITVKIIQ